MKSYIVKIRTEKAGSHARYQRKVIQDPDITNPVAAIGEALLNRLPEEDHKHVTNVEIEEIEE